MKTTTYLSLSSLMRQFPNAFRLVVCMLVFVSVSFNSKAQNQTKEYFQTKLKSNTTVGYLSYLPPAYKSSNNDFPLMIFLHGMGETGSNLDNLLYYGPPNLIHYNKWPSDRPFIVISPQNPSAFGSSWNPDLVDEVISEVAAKYRVDESRIYVTGTSMGGNGAWNYATSYPDRVAATVPICGWGTTSKACEMKDVPVWAFHNEGDGVVHVSGTKNMIDALEKCGPNPWPKETIYPDGGHDAWSRTYDLSAGHDIYSWMLSYSKAGSKPAENRSPSANAGSDKTITLPQNTLTLNGSGSDPDGSITSYSWTKVNGPAVSMNNTTTANLSLSKLEEGSYTFRLTVKDNKGASASDEAKVTVNPDATPAPGQGLKYSYYEGNWSKLPSFSGLSAKKTGTVANFSLDAKAKNDHYAFQFEGYIEIATEGNYTFYTKSDDGSKLYINSKEVVNNDGLHGFQEKSGSIYLSKGKHQLKTTYFEGTGDDRLEVRYSGPGVAKQLIPSNRLFTEGEVAPPPPAGNQGLNYAYYEGNWSSLPNFNSLSPKKSGTVPNFSLSNKLRGDNYAFQFTGSIEILSSGNYTFFTSSDDGSKLYINSKEIVDNDGLHGEREKSGSVYLEKGKHAITVTYFEGTGGDVLSVKYSGPGVSKQPIPNARLFAEGDTPPPSSPPPAQGEQGLNYRYYEGDWYTLPNFGGLNAKKQGKVANFSLGVKGRSDLYAMEFDGYLEVTRAGNYNFFTSSDDGSKLYIDGKEIVNNDGAHGKQERKGSIYLSVGKHPIKVTYFERMGDDILEIQYSGPGISKQPIPGSKLSSEEGSEPLPVTESPGLSYAYYEGNWSKVPNFKSLSPKKTGVVTNFSLANKMRGDEYAFQFQGYIDIATAGNYIFYTSSDDGSKLYIDDKMVVDNDGLHGSKEKSGSVYLAAGKHSINVAYFEGRGDDILQVSYSGPGFSKKAIPNNVLSTNNEASGSATMANITTDNLDLNESTIEDSEGEALNENQKSTAYPNPFEDKLTVSVSSGLSGTVEVSLMDFTGKILLQEKKTVATYDNQISLDMSTTDIPKGMYLLQIVAGNTKEVLRIKK